MTFTQKKSYRRLFFLLLAGVVISLGTSGVIAAQTDTVEPSETVKDLLSKMEEKEYLLYERAQDAALQIRLELYQQCMGQRVNSSLEDRPATGFLGRQVADLYGQLLLLRVETILEIKRRWPEQSITDLVDMLQYSPDLILNIMDEIDQMVSLQGLDLSRDQKKAVSTSWLHRDIQRMKKAHEINLILIDLKVALTAKLPGSVRASDQVAAIVALQNEVINFRNQTHKEIWDLLSPEQREKFVHLVYVAIRTQ